MKEFLDYIGDSPIESMKYKWNIRPYHKTNYLNINRDEFYDLYISKNYTAVELAKFYKCARNTIYEKAQEFGITKCASKKPGRPDIWKQCDKICQLYDEMSITEIAKYFSTSRATIKKVLITYNKMGDKKE